MSGIYLPPSATFSEDKLKENLSPLTSALNKNPIDALFTFSNGRVTTFKMSEDGQEVDMEKLKNDLNTKSFSILEAGKPQALIFSVPIKILKPKISTDNSYGRR